MHDKIGNHAGIPGKGTFENVGAHAVSLVHCTDEADGRRG